MFVAYIIKGITLTGYRLITLWQMLWYTVTVVVRLQQGHSITTLELTTITFAVVMLATSAMWFLKPQISVVTKIKTKNECTMDTIRDFARHQVRLLKRCYMVPKT